MTKTKDICANCKEQNLSAIANLQEENRQLLLQNNDLKLRAHNAEYQLKDVDETLKAEESQRTNRVSVIEDMRRELERCEAALSMAIDIPAKIISECPYMSCDSLFVDECFECINAMSQERNRKKCWKRYLLRERG